MQVRVVRHAAILVVATVMMAAIGCTPTGSGGPAAGSTELITSKCTMCHTIDRINQANKDQAGWEQTIARMRTQGRTADGCRGGPDRRVPRGPERGQVVGTEAGSFTYTVAVRFVTGG